MTLDGVLLSGNRAAFGGAILNAGDATLTNVTVENNVTLFWGSGAIQNASNMTLSNTTVEENVGNGIYSDGTMTVSNSTISANLVAGIYNRGAATVANTTITGNTAVATGFGGGINNDIGTLGAALTLKNTIVAGNTGADCGGPTPVVSKGNNLISDESCPFTGPGDLQNTDPLLGPLVDNGGATLTHALLPGSPAIDTGSNSACPRQDQRGLPRPFDGDADGQAVCDIGAYEFHHCLADANEDGIVDLSDIRLVASAVTSRPGSPRWNEAADVNADGVVDNVDLRVVVNTLVAGSCV